MGQALYRKYRSKTLDEVVGQEHITNTLKNALKNDKISHAYLFTGPRGVGKTSIARILAHEVNKLPYDEEATHLDIIEIDAASNRRIDEIRDLRNKVHIMPTSAKYKVYIIDEVHMLTKEAFNALLKTLEEPPQHVIFVLATTEAHKLPETIISRTQRFTFKPINIQQVIAHLKNLAKAEKINVTDGALALIAEHGEGSFRDSISLLDQASNLGGAVQLDDVQRMLGIAPQAAIDNLISVLVAGPPKELLEQLTAVREQGFLAAHIAKQLGQALRQQLINQQSQLDKQTITKLLTQLLEVPVSTQPERLLEIVLLDIVLSRDGDEPEVFPAITLVSDVPSGQQSVATKKRPLPDKQEAPKASKSKPAGQQKTDIPAQPFTLEVWPAVLTSIKTQHNTLYSILRMGEPSLKGRTLTLTFGFGFHQKRASELKNRQLIIDTVKQHVSEAIDIVCVAREKVTQKVILPVAQPVGKNTDIETISNIFGGAEVLES